MPIPDHILVVIEENHDADQVFGNPYAPYINGTLAANGLVYTNAHATDHPSQPNYLEMFAGTNPGVRGDDYNDQPFSIPNLGAELLASGRTFAGYSEDLPSVGFTGAQASGINGNASYAEKHNPWAQFQGSGPNQLPASVNQPFTTFQSLQGNFAALPTISFVVPNQYNDMHNAVSSAGHPAVNGTGVDSQGNPVNGDSTIQNGDAWLLNNIEAYRQWATTHNSLLITVWDENDSDLTDANNIPLIIDGDPNLVQAGVNSSYVNHFDLLRTLENYYGLTPTGAAAMASGLPANNSNRLIPTPPISPNDLRYSSAASGFNHFIDLLNFEASYSDLIHAFGINQQMMQDWYNQYEPKEQRVETFDGLDYIASYGDLVRAYRSAGSMHAVQDAGATHFINYGLAEGRGTSFNGLDYIASYGDLIAAFGANNDAGAYHYIEYGSNEHRTANFDGLDYIASYVDLIRAFGANEQAGAAHYINWGNHERRATTFEGLSYIAQYTDLMTACGSNNDAGASHYITYGSNEGRSTSFNVAAYETAHPDLQGRYATNDQFLTAYINTYTTTGHFLT
jgi:hypothetical protein